MGRVRDGEWKMKTKSAPQSYSQGSVMWEIVLFDYAGKLAFIPSKRSFCVDRGVQRQT